MDTHADMLQTDQKGPASKTQAYRIVIKSVNSAISALRVDPAINPNYKKMESNTVKIKSRLLSPGSYSIINAGDYDPQTHEIFSGEDLPGDVVRREVEYIWDRNKEAFFRWQRNRGE